MVRAPARQPKKNAKYYTYAEEAEKLAKHLPIPTLRQLRFIKEHGREKTRLDTSATPRRHLVYRHPLTAFVAGATGTGKTYWLVYQLINGCLDIQPTKILYCHGSGSGEQKIFNTLKEKIKYKATIEMHEGLPTEKTLASSLDGPSVVVLDDLQGEMRTGEGARFLEALFSRISHHGAKGMGISVFVICQDLFYSPAFKVARRNTTLYALFNAPGDRLGMRNIASNVYPDNRKLFLEAWAHAVKQLNRCLLVDLDLQTPNRLRLRSDSCDPTLTNYIYSWKCKKNSVIRKRK